MQYENLPEQWQDLYKNLNSFCSREEIAKKSNMIARGTLANLDCQGVGIEGKIKVGKKILYPRKKVIDFLMQLVEGIDNTRKGA